MHFNVFLGKFVYVHYFFMVNGQTKAKENTLEVFETDNSETQISMLSAQNKISDKEN